MGKAGRLKSMAAIRSAHRLGEWWAMAVSRLKAEFTRGREPAGRWGPMDVTMDGKCEKN